MRSKERFLSGLPSPRSGYSIVGAAEREVYLIAFSQWQYISYQGDNGKFGDGGVLELLIITHGFR